VHKKCGRLQFVLIGPYPTWSDMEGTTVLRAYLNLSLILFRQKEKW
jgi:hypothetical protein